MASKFRKLLSFRLDSRNIDIVNSDEIRTNDHIKASSPNNFDKWDIPKVNVETTYKVDAFNFRTAFSTKTYEEIVCLENGLQTISSIKLEAIQIRLKGEFCIMHFGLVQVAVKPFIRKGISAPIYMALGDKRLKKYKSSLLGMINVDIHIRPIFFNGSQDFCVDFSSLMAPEALKLDVHIPGDGFHDFKIFTIM